MYQCIQNMKNTIFKNCLGKYNDDIQLTKTTPTFELTKEIILPPPKKKGILDELLFLKIFFRNQTILFTLRGDYTTHFGNSILYYNFLMNSLKFIKVYIIRERISQGRQSWYYFFYQKSTFLRKSQKKNNVFCHFSFKTGYKKNWNSKDCFGIVLLT